MTDNNVNRSTGTPDTQLKAAVYKRRIIVSIAAVAVFLLVILIAQLTRSDGLTENTASTSDVVQSAPADSMSQTSPPGTSDQQAYQDSPVATRQADDPLAIGDVNAPVVLVEWTDLACKYCGVFSRNILPKLKEHYVDPGLVRIEFHTVSFISPDDSPIGAVGAQAAAKQGKGIEFIEAAYQSGSDDSGPDLSREALIGFAKQAGVPDMDAFTQDLDSEELHTKVATTTSIAQQMGINGVPSFNTETTLFSGAQPYEVFQELLNDALTRAGATPPQSE